MFEEAYFLLKEGEEREDCTTLDMINEANRIIEQNLSEDREDSGFFRSAFNIVKRYSPSFFIGAAVGAISVLPFLL